MQARPEIPRNQSNLATEQANLANLLLQRGQTDEAKELAVESVKAFRSLSEQYPDELEFAEREAASRSVLGAVLRDRMELELATGILDEAIDFFAARSKEFPERAEYRNRLAENLALQAQVSVLSEQPAASQSQLERALKTLDEAPQSDVSTPARKELAAWLQLHLADSAWSRGDHEAARSHYLTAEKLRESLPQTAESLRHWGWLLTFGLSPESHQPARAVELLKKATAVTPTNADYWFCLAVAQTQAMQWDDASRSLTQASGCKQPSLGRLELIQSLIERHQGRTESANERLRRGSELIEKTSRRPRKRALPPARATGHSECRSNPSSSRTQKVSGQSTAQPPIQTLIDQDAHDASVSNILILPASITAKTCSRLTDGKPSRKSSIDSPPSR